LCYRYTIPQYFQILKRSSCSSGNGSGKPRANVRSSTRYLPALASAGREASCVQTVATRAAVSGLDKSPDAEHRRLISAVSMSGSKLAVHWEDKSRTPGALAK
jgi:hypothetical protein